MRRHEMGPYYRDLVLARFPSSRHTEIRAAEGPRLGPPAGTTTTRIYEEKEFFEFPFLAACQ